ncbi:hypothetical protein [Streptomyces sp. NPDC058671]|uniref:hypothetical protein n=1 Tax=Streptomyces sp. NPDC058671 TaxID=3346590 RepID=UPI00365373F8
MDQSRVPARAALPGVRRHNDGADGPSLPGGGSDDGAPLAPDAARTALRTLRVVTSHGPNG